MKRIFLILPLVITSLTIIFCSNILDGYYNSIDTDATIAFIKQQVPNCVEVKQVSKNTTIPDVYVATDKAGTKFFYRVSHNTIELQRVP